MYRRRMHRLSSPGTVMYRRRVHRLEKKIHDTFEMNVSWIFSFVCIR